MGKLEETPKALLYISCHSLNSCTGMLVDRDYQSPQFNLLLTTVARSQTSGGARKR